MLSSIPMYGGNLFEFLIMVILTVMAGFWIGMLLSEVRGGYEIR